jgi:hypothetical protein
VLEEQHFHPKTYDRSGFHRGEPLLDEYLHKYAAQQSARGLASVFVLVDDAAPNRILGFYTLSAAQVDVGSSVQCSRISCKSIRCPATDLGAWSATWRAVGPRRESCSWPWPSTDAEKPELQ